MGSHWGKAEMTGMVGVLLYYRTMGLSLRKIAAKVEERFGVRFNSVTVFRYFQRHDALVKALGSVGDHIEQSDKRQHEHSLMQSAAIVEMGNLVKSLGVRLGVIENQPARGPKTKGVEQPLAKSFQSGDGAPGGSEGDLSKSDISEALDGLMIESMEGNRNGLTKGGEDILVEISKFEQMSKLSPSMFNEVKGFISRRGAAQ